MDNSNAADDIKCLAIKGKFAEIENKYGKKKCGKAENYVEVKLASLKEKQKQGLPMAGISYATPFMLFAAKSDGTAIRTIAEEFLKEDANQKDESQLSVSTDLSSKEFVVELAKRVQKNTPSVSSVSKDEDDEAEHEEPDGAAKPVVVTPVRAPSAFTKPAVAKSFRPPAPPKSATKEIVDKNEAQDGEAPASEKAKSKQAPAMKSKAAKSVKPAKEPKQAKAPKDPDLPKAAKSSYMFFIGVIRKTILEESPGMSCVDVAKEAGARWKTLSEEEKQPYTDLAGADKQRHDAEMAAYKEEHPVKFDATNGKAKRKSSAGADKTHTAPAKRIKQKPSKENGTESDAESAAESAGGEEAAEETPQVRAGSKRGAAVAAKQGISKAILLEGAGDHHTHMPSKHKKAHQEGGENSLHGDGDGNSDADDDGSAAGSSKTKPKRDHRSSKVVPRKQTSATTSSKEKHPANVVKSTPNVSAAAHASLKGFKQDDLPEEMDLLHSELIPRASCKFPAPMEFHVGKAMTLVLQPYRTFLAELPADAVDAKTTQDIQRVCALPRSVVHCTILSYRTVLCSHLPSHLSDNHQSSADTPALFYTLLQLCIDKKEYTVLHADLASPLLTRDTFLVETTKYRECLKAPWLVVGSQVRRLFGGEDPDIAICHEGSIYDIRSDVATNPYGAILVVWLQQEKGTNHWVYEYTQTDSACSPWDLELSSYVLLENIRPPTMPRALLVGALKPASIIEYIKGLDAAPQFLDDMSKCTDTDYCAMFPNAEDRLDLLAISRLCRKGRYDDTCTDTSTGASASASDSTSAKAKAAAVSSVGIGTLFEDLQCMVANSKAYNACNAHFLPWRLADMMDKALHRLKVALADAHHIPSLEHSLQQDAEDLQEQLDSAMAVEM